MEALVVFWWIVFSTQIMKILSLSLPYSFTNIILSPMAIFSWLGSVLTFASTALSNPLPARCPSNFPSRGIGPCAEPPPIAVLWFCQMLDLWLQKGRIWSPLGVCASQLSWDSSREEYQIRFPKAHCPDSRHQWPRGYYTSARIPAIWECIRTRFHTEWSSVFMEPCILESPLRTASGCWRQRNCHNLLISSKEYDFLWDHQTFRLNFWVELEYFQSWDPNALYCFQPATPELEPHQE